jgi:hypothetical protein
MRTSKNTRVTISLSTTPKRINNILPTLESLFQQTRSPEVIRLNVPKFCPRLNEHLESIPSYLSYLEIDTQLEIHITEDYGPATKFYPACKSIDKSKNHFLIWLDDDILYANTLVEELITNCPEKTAISATGFTLLPDHHKMILRHHQEADILEGWGGVCCRTSDIPNLEQFQIIKPYTEMNFLERCAWHSDDFVMSRALQDNGIKTVVCCTEKFNRFMNKPQEFGLGEDALQNSSITNGHHVAYSALEYKRSFDRIMREIKGTSL